MLFKHMLSIYIKCFLSFPQGEVHEALIVLQKGVELCFPENKAPCNSKNQLIHGRAMLLVGRFMEETANFESNAVMKKYKVIWNTTVNKAGALNINVFLK